MAAVASSQMPEGLRGLDEQFSEPGASSRFTAVNGRGSPPVTERSNPTSGHDDQRNGVSNGLKSPEQVHDVITVQQTLPPAPQSTQEQVSPVVREQPTPYSAPPARSISRSPPSRKRSFPEAFGDPNGNHLSQAHHRTHTEAPEYVRGPQGPYSHAASRLPPSHEIDPTRQQPPLSSDFDPHAHTRQPYYTQPPRDESEARLAEALQRENGNGSLNGETFASPEADDRHRQQYGDYSGGRQPMSDAERKRRKRVFSNRTKTGCMTCRKRKKKCDELHPECKPSPSRWHSRRRTSEMVCIWRKCRNTNAQQATTAFVVDSFVRATMREMPGKNQPPRSSQFPCSPKMAMELQDRMIPESTTTIPESITLK